MICTVLNKQQWEKHKEEIDKLLEDGKQVNLSYAPVVKLKTKRQTGFFFAALVNQIYLYCRNVGWNCTEKQVRKLLYAQVAQVVPSMSYDMSFFGMPDQVKSVQDLDTAEEMSEFINGVFTVLDTNPLYEGLKLTPDTYYAWINHITNDDILASRAAELPERDNDYLNHLRDCPCIICGVQHRSDAHHVRDTRTAGEGIKSPDWYALPLCHKCHMTIAHGTGFKDAIKWIKIDLMDFCRICYQRWKAKL